MEDCQIKQIDAMTQEAGQALYNLAATIESNRRAEPGIIYRWCWETLTDEQKAPYLHDALMIARDHPAPGVTG